eukprot:maker-scaffold459_size165548-snap-gene-0.21 protein:Tk05712 transcript:maker-scaffold459_size165548-snap-gene-0.21-mRNA-1 annotation:"innexin inx2"
MFDVFGSVKDLIKLDSICIDNNVFRLHYKATFVILVVCSLLVTSRQYIGDPIDCIVEEIPNNVMDTYCWIHSTFSIPNKVMGLEGYDVSHPGVAPHAALGEGESVRYHKYYQWVCFTLFFQALLFYVPRYLWKTWEGGKVKMLVQEMNVPIVDADTKKDRIKLLVDYFSYNRNNHEFYALKFFLCEFLNFVNVFGQIYFMDFFLGGEFTQYGIDVLAMTELQPEEREDPMSKVFPKVTKCTFRKFGPSGTVETFDGLCVLPLNIINEKIYVFLWFWFIIVTAITGIHIIYRLIMLFVPQIREVILRTRARLATPGDVSEICRQSKLGDWFLLYQLAKNIDPLIFKEFIGELSATFSILVVFSILVTSNQYIGDPIDCIVEEIPQDVMDTFCWIHSTFSIPSKVLGDEGYDMAHPGVAPGDGEEVREHKYYQWVCFALYFQAVFFYAPKFIWSRWEGGKLKKRVGDLANPIVDLDTQEEQVTNLVNYLADKKGLLNNYAIGFFICEILNLINVVGQIFFLDAFLGGQFTEYGTDVLAVTEMPQHQRVDPMAKVFPKVTKCTYHKFGPSGTVENFDGLCVLPLNIINEKIFVFLWFWFIFVATVSCIHAVFRIVTLFVPAIRQKILLVKARLANPEDVLVIARHSKIGDWFLINQLGKNIDPLIFKDCLSRIRAKVYPGKTWILVHYKLESSAAEFFQVGIHRGL